MGNAAFKRIGQELLERVRNVYKAHRYSSGLGPLRPQALKGVVILCLLLLLGSGRAAQTGPKRVVIIHSFGLNFAPSALVTAAFQSELAEQWGMPIEFHEVSLTGSAFSPSTADGPTAKYLQALLGGREPDLIVPFGGPAVRFALRSRTQLFPSAPLLLAGVEARHLESLTLDTNTTAMAVKVDFSSHIEHILRILPGTTNIAVVIGSSQLEVFWKQALQREFAVFTNHVGFTWLDQYSLVRMQEHVGHLPPHSAIFFIALIEDAAGVAYEYEKAVKVLRETANAPIMGLSAIGLGLGIVGGPLVDPRADGQKIASVGVRILNGESPGNIRVPVTTSRTPVYDWRELRRWKIPESRLPPGSIIKYRVRTIWERYWLGIFTGGLIVVAQAVLITGLVMNLRRRRKAEHSLRDSEERMKLAQRELALASRMSILGELAGSLTHELRQPLAAIVTSGEAGQRFMEPIRRNDEEVREALEEVVQQGRRAGEIIGGMRAMLEKDAGPMTVQDINLVITKVMQIVRSDLVIRDVRATLKLDPHLPPVKACGVQLEQVVLNLVLNACDAMSGMPAKERHLVIESQRADGQVEVSISDSGPGFTQEMLQHAFEPFRSTKAKGLGLGLAICRSIIGTHGGRLTVANSRDKGATVRFTLPAQSNTGI